MIDEEHKNIQDKNIQDKNIINNVLEQERIEQQRIEQEKAQSLQQVQNIMPNEIDTTKKDFSRFMGHDDDERLQNTRPQGDSTYVGDGINHVFKDYDIGAATQDAWNDVSLHDTTLFSDINDFSKNGTANPDILFSDVMYNKDSSDIVNAGSINEGISNRDFAIIDNTIKTDPTTLLTQIDTLRSNYLDSMFAPDKSGFDSMSNDTIVRDILEKHSDTIIHTGTAKFDASEIAILSARDNDRWTNGLDANNEVHFNIKEQDIFKDHMSYKADHQENLRRANETLDNFRQAVKDGSLDGTSRAEIQRATTLLSGMSLKNNKITELNNSFKAGKITREEYSNGLKEANGIHARLGVAHGNNGHVGRVNTVIRATEHGLRDRDGSDFTGDETRSAIMEVRQLHHMANDFHESRQRKTITSSRKLEDKANRNPNATQTEKDLAKRQREKAEEYQSKRQDRHTKHQQNDESERLKSRLEERDARATFNKSKDDFKREKRNRNAETKEKRLRSRGNNDKADRIKNRNNAKKSQDRRRDERNDRKLDRQKNRDERRSRFAIIRRFNDFRTRHWWASPGLHFRNWSMERIKGSRFGGFLADNLPKLRVLNIRKLAMDSIRQLLAPLKIPFIYAIAIMVFLLFLAGVVGTMFGGSDSEEGGLYNVNRYQKIADKMTDLQYNFQNLASKGAQKAVRDQAGTKDIKSKLNAQGVKTYDAFDVDVNLGQTRHIVDEYGNERDTMNTFIPILAMSKYRIFAQLDDSNTKEVTKYCDGLWAGSDDTDSSTLKGTDEQDVYGKGDTAYLKSNGSNKFSYQKWVGNQWAGPNHTVKYFPDIDANGNKEDTIKFTSNNSWFVSLMGGDAECAYSVEHHDDVKDCPNPGHHGDFYTKGQKILDTDGDGIADTDIDNKYVSKTKIDECDGAVPMQGTAKYRLHKHTEDCYKTVYIYNGVSYDSIDAANNVKQSDEARLSETAQKKLNAFNSEMDKQVNAFRSTHPNYNDYIMKHIGAYSQSTYYDFIMSLKDSSSTSGPQVNDTTHKQYTISKVSNMYKVWIGSTQEKVDYDKKTSSLKRAYQSAAGTNSGVVSVEKDHNQLICGLEEHYDKTYFQQYHTLRLTPWHSESDPGDFETWYECPGHCPGHITPYIDYAFVGNVDNLMAYDEDRMSEPKPASRAIPDATSVSYGDKRNQTTPTPYTDNRMPTPEATPKAKPKTKPKTKPATSASDEDKTQDKNLDNVNGFKDSMWNHWDNSDKSVIHNLIGDYDSGYKDGKDLLESLGIKTQAIGVVSRKEQAAFEGTLNKSVGDGGKDPEKTKAMLSYAESLWTAHSYHYAMDGRRAKDPYLDCSSFVGMVINNAWGPSSGVSRASTTDTFLHLPGTGQWSSISQVKSGSILLGKNSNVHHVVLVAGVKGNNITYIECNIAFGGLPDGINVRTNSFSHFKDKTYSYDYINNDFAS